MVILSGQRYVSNMSHELVVEDNAPLASLCSLGLGGCARYLVTAGDERTVIEAVRWARQRRVPVAILGGGTNVVVSDQGFDGLVIRMAQRGVSVGRDSGLTLIAAMAGEPWDALVERAVGDELCGIECLSGIPGSVGATVIQNVGAYGQEISDTVASVRTLDLSSLRIGEMSPQHCQLGYRDSVFKRTPDAAAVLSVTLGLKPGASPSVRHSELEQMLGKTRASIGPAEVRQAVLELRRAKAMLLDGDDPDSRSVGSFFTNPLLPRPKAAKVIARAVQLGLAAAAEEVPQFPSVDGRVKLAAAWLIERSGFCKGYRSGRVGISSRHALALVHHGQGTTAELLALARRIQDAVKSTFDLHLVPEPAFLGFAKPPL